jgi:3,4-dihydroxy 2-butanone 4-phosphate synthase/GTP cyclohydrolase II
MRDGGTMARRPDLAICARVHGLRIGAVTDLIHHRSRTERIVERIAERPLTTPHGAFRLVVYRDKISDATHLALVRGPIAPDAETLVRVHEPLSVMDLLDADSASHSWTIPDALAAVAKAGRGVVPLHRRKPRKNCAAARDRRAPPPQKWTCATTDRRADPARSQRRACVS